MSSTPLVLNEWVIHDLNGDNSKKRQKETLQFLRRIQEKSDHIVVLYGSVWARKAYQLMSESRPELREISKFLHRNFLLDPQKCNLVYPHDIPPIPGDVQAVLSSDDSYLIALCLLDPESIIVTTDEGLIEALSKFSSITVRLRHEFLKSYT
jgi:hypothetical protein